MFKKFSLAVIALMLLFGVTGCISFNKSAPSVGSQIGVFASPDRGEKWVQKANLMTPGAQAGSIAAVNTLCLALDPSDTSAVYIGTRADGVFYSYNGGDGWSRAGNFTKVAPQKVVYSLAVDPKNKCTVYAGAGNQIYRTRDCNRTWVNAFTTPKSTEVLRAILVDWYNTKNVYVAAADGSIYKSENSGDSWVKLYDFVQDIEDIEMDANDSRVLYVATKSDGLYKTSDSGATWLSLQKEMKDIGSNVRNGYGLEVAKDKTNALFYLSKFGLLKSLDSGLTWTQVKLLTDEGKIEFFAFALDPNNSNNIYIADATILYRTSNGGQTWETKKMPTTQRISDLKVHLKDSNVLFAGFKSVEN